MPTIIYYFSYRIVLVLYSNIYLVSLCTRMSSISAMFWYLYRKVGDAKKMPHIHVQGSFMFVRERIMRERRKEATNSCKSKYS